MSTQAAARSSNELGTSKDWHRRLLLHHAPLALVSAVVLVLFMSLPLFAATGHGVDLSSGAFPQQRGERGSISHGGTQTAAPGHGGSQTSPPVLSGSQGSRTFLSQFTVATGYVATGLLALTLLIGPANLLLRKRNPISSYLRRDMGMWTAIFSVVHVFYGLQVHARLFDFLNYFFAPDGSPLLNSFGLGNWTGLAATVIVVGLLAISSDFALRKLKFRTWKWLQRLNYALFALVILHAFFYGALLRLESPFTLLLALSVIAAFSGQIVGVRLWRRKRRVLRTAAT